MFLFRCMNSCGMYCNCELVGLTFGVQSLYAYIGYNEGFGMEWLEMIQSRVGYFKWMI